MVTVNLILQVMNYLDRNIIVAENMKKFLSMAKNWKGANVSCSVGCSDGVQLVSRSVSESSVVTALAPAMQSVRQSVSGQSVRPSDRLTD